MDVLYAQQVNDLNEKNAEFVGMTLVSIVYHEPAVFQFNFARPGHKHSGRFIQFEMSTNRRIKTGEWKYVVPE